MVHENFLKLLCRYFFFDKRQRLDRVVHSSIKVQKTLIYLYTSSMLKTQQRSSAKVIKKQDCTVLVYKNDLRYNWLDIDKRLEFQVTNLDLLHL
jgi:hypothetical protein